MQPSDFKVGPIDHVELFVPDRYEAARWYGQTLGLQILSGLEDWAVPGGPLMISSDGGHTMLALFEGDSRGSPSTAGDHRVAFRVDGAAFVHFLQWVGEHPVFSEAGEELKSLRVVDHEKAYSVYFCDPYGNRFEITSYEADFIQLELGT